MYLMYWFTPSIEDISASTYTEMLKDLAEIDLTKIIETDDETDLAGELACAGGSCEIK